jgi:hypothetical protein
MKKLALVLLTIAFTVGCSSKKAAVAGNNNPETALSFEYEAQTRGTYNKVVVTQDSIITIKDRGMKNVVSKPVSSSDWNYLMGNARKMNLEGLKDLKAPSTKNYADAALAANLKVIKGTTTYTSSTFDHGNPPAQISGIVHRILNMSDMKAK